MHDEYIVGYSVNIEEKNIIIHIYNNNEKKKKSFCFSDVLTHSFKCIIDYNIVMDFKVYDISCFIKENQKELKEMKGYCWPIDYQTEQELINFLVDKEYKYIKINSSYGMCGWILAKYYKICE